MWFQLVEISATISNNLYHDQGMKKASGLIISTTNDKYDTLRGKDYIE